MKFWYYWICAFCLLTALCALISCWLDRREARRRERRLQESGLAELEKFAVVDHVVGCTCHMRGGFAIICEDCRNFTNLYLRFELRRLEKQAEKNGPGATRAPVQFPP